MEITFYGVRGSLPAPSTAAEVQAQIARALFEASSAGARFESPADADRWLTETLPFHQRASYGGDTTCILVRCGEHRLIVDAGSGIRRLGADLLSAPRGEKLELDLLFTHMHLDHIMGFAFFSPLFVPKDRAQARLAMYGGASWQADLQSVLSSTVSPPLFPVELEKLTREAATLEYHPISDGLTVTLDAGGEVRVTCRLLNHPDETYGFRIEYAGRVFTVATDAEPSDATDPMLVELARGADVLYTDSQFDHAQYTGAYDGQSRVGWGHGYAEWCGKYAAEAGVRLAVMGHHDAGSSNDRVHAIADKMRGAFPNTVPGWDGLKVAIRDEEVVAMGAGPGGTDMVVPRRPGTGGGPGP